MVFIFGELSIINTTGLVFFNTQLFAGYIVNNMRLNN